MFKKIKKIGYSIQNIFKESEEDNKNLKTHSFTYFIPAPPMKKIGHREKIFDKVFFEYINKGHTILDIQMQAIEKGLWVTVISKSSKDIDLEESYIPELSFDNEIEELG